MESLYDDHLHLAGRVKELIRTLAPQIILIHHRRGCLGEKQIIIRFQNGYGAALFPVSPPGNDPVLQMLTLKFHGPKINDYKLAQYTPVPEITRGDGDEIMELCRRVSLLPEIQPLTLSPAPPPAKAKKERWEKRCSNF